MAELTAESAADLTPEYPAEVTSESVAELLRNPHLYSIAETAKANGVEPHAYFRHLYTHLPAAKIVDDFDALLPWNVKALLAKT